MNTFKLKILSAVSVAVGFLAPAGCSGESDPRAVDHGEDAGEDVSSRTDADAPPADASVSDVADDRRIAWDSGADRELATVLEMWTGGLVYCARVKRSSSTTVECWGNNISGELGRGDTSDDGTTFKPFPVLGPDAPYFKKVANNGNWIRGMVCAVTEGNDLKCWGGSYDSVSPIKASVPDEPFLANVRDVDMAAGTACAVRTNGHVACWGTNMNGELGLGYTDYVVHPVPEEIPTFTAEQVSCGSASTCALEDGEVWCWGMTSVLGNGPAFGWTPTPTRVAGLTDITKVVVGESRAFALASDKTLWYWGVLTGMPAYTPTKVLDPTSDDPNRVLSGVEDIKGSCVRLTDGKVKCLSIKQTGGYEFTEVGRVADAVSLGDSCALDAAGILRCWGNNSSGQLGLPPTTLSTSAAGRVIEF